MFRDFFRALAELFTERRSRLEVSGLLLTLAMLPVSELLVTRMFSHLILHGPDRYRQDPGGVVLDGAVFFGAFALSRAIHHVVRLNRVRVFRRGFESSGQARAASTEAWSWAAAFELSTAMVALIQVAAFCGLFIWLDPAFGLANLTIGIGVLLVIAQIYAGQLTRQHAYLAEGTEPGGTGVGERVGTRIRDAEVGAVVASLAMALSLGVVLYRAVQGAVAGADAIVLFIGLRMMYSQIGNLSASAMRFARVKARLAVAGRSAVPDDFDDPDDEVGAPLDSTPPPATPSPHRAHLVNQMLLAGQRGDLGQVQSFGSRLNSVVEPLAEELDAQEVAEAFALLADGEAEDVPLALMWWARPFPGSAGNWLSPFLLHRLTGRPVLFQKPDAPAEAPHLVLTGSILGWARRTSIVVGTGAVRATSGPDPLATFLSVRGPLTAETLRAAGGPSVDRYGDTAALVCRALPIERTGGNGRLAVVRDRSHAAVPLTLPDHLDEVRPAAARPDDVAAFVRTLTGYDGVVTSDPAIAAVCYSYGLPCAPIAFDEDPELEFVRRDLALGLGLDPGTTTVIGTDLGRVRWTDVLVAQTVDPVLLDDIRDAAGAGLATYLDRVVPA